MKNPSLPPSPRGQYAPASHQVELRSFARSALRISGSSANGTDGSGQVNLLHELKERYSASLAEGRHPDIASHKPWLILTIDLDAERVA